MFLLVYDNYYDIYTYLFDCSHLVSLSSSASLEFLMTMHFWVLKENKMFGFACVMNVEVIVFLLKSSYKISK